MTARERLNFEMLRTGPCVSAEYVTDFYGLPWPLPHDAGRDFNTWTAQLPRRRTCSDGYGSRYELEAFLQHQGLLPKKWMAARFGMTEPALDEVLARLPDLGMRPSRYVVYPELIAKSLAEDIVPNLPGLKFRTFSDHDSFCQRLHADLAKSLGVTILPLFCAVSKQLREYPPRFARDFDCITCAPLSAAHQMWLDFRKPMNLGSDRCSKLLFAENREGEDDLFSCIAGTSEPSDLDQYRALLAGGQHA